MGAPRGASSLGSGGLFRGGAELRPNRDHGRPEGSGTGARRGASSQCHQRRPRGLFRRRADRKTLTESGTAVEKGGRRRD